MATVFKNVITPGLGISPTTVLTSNATAVTTIIGCSLTNTTGSIIQATIKLNDTIAGTTAFFVNNVTIPPNTSLRAVTGGEKLILGPSTNVIINSNIANSIDFVMSWVEIS